MSRTESRKRYAKGVVIIAAVAAGFALSALLGALYGVKRAEDLHTSDVRKLDRLLTGIHACYAQHGQYPTNPGFYSREVWGSTDGLPLASVDDKEAKLYCGVGGAYVFTVRFLSDGSASVTRGPDRPAGNGASRPATSRTDRVH